MLLHAVYKKKKKKTKKGKKEGEHTMNLTFFFFLLHDTHCKIDFNDISPYTSPNFAKSVNIGESMFTNHSLAKFSAPPELFCACNR